MLRGLEARVFTTAELTAILSKSDAGKGGDEADDDVAMAAPFKQLPSSLPEDYLQSHTDKNKFIADIKLQHNTPPNDHKMRDDDLSDHSSSIAGSASFTDIHKEDDILRGGRDRAASTSSVASSVASSTASSYTGITFKRGAKSQCIILYYAILVGDHFLFSI
jgi:hypothetical protein